MLKAEPITHCFDLSFTSDISKSQDIFHFYIYNKSLIKAVYRQSLPRELDSIL